MIEIVFLIFNIYYTPNCIKKCSSYTNNLYDQLKVCFSNNKYPDTIQTRTTPIVNSIFLIEKKMFL